MIIVFKTFLIDPLLLTRLGCYQFQPLMTHPGYQLFLPHPKVYILTHLIQGSCQVVAGPRYLPGLSVCFLPCPQSCKCGGDVVLRHNALRDTLVHFLHRAHASVQVEAGAGLFPDHSQSRPVDILLQNWNLGRPCALDISVVSPLNPSTLAEAGATFGAVLEATETR